MAVSCYLVLWWSAVRPAVWRVQKEKYRPTVTIEPLLVPLKRSAFVCCQLLLTIAWARGPETGTESYMQTDIIIGVFETGHRCMVFLSSLLVHITPQWSVDVLI